MSEIGQAGEIHETGGQASPPAMVGQLLREARERMGLSAADVARQLRLALRQVEALEANDFSSLPGNTIVRGFIRNYARILQVDPAPFLAAYQASLPSPQAEKITLPAENIDITPRASRRWLWYVTAVALLVLGAPLLIYALLRDDGRSAAVAPARVSPAPGGQVAVPMALPAPAPIPAEGGVGAQAPGTDASGPGQTNGPAIAPAEGAKAAPGKGIRLVFDEEAWVEIRDRSGRKIFSQLNPKGAEETIVGEGPFSLVIGNAAKVRLAYNGKPVDLQPYIKVNVARLTLE